MSSHFFTPFILQPSRLKSKTLIDHIFLNSLEYISTSGNLLIELSDHLTQFLILEGFAKKQKLPELSIYKRDWKSFSDREFEETVIRGVNWNEICMLRFKDPSVSLKSFHDTIKFYVDEMAPLKKLSIKQIRLVLKPWITNEILQKCKQRDDLLVAIKNETDDDRKLLLQTQYKKLRNEITNDKRRSKKNYFATQFEKNQSRSAHVWKLINSMINIKQKKSSSIKLMSDDGNVVSDPSKIANTFNDHFSSLGAEVQSRIPIERGSYYSYLVKKNKDGRLFINPDGHVFFLTPTDPKEVSEVIDNLNAKKSAGPNGIPVFLLKKFKDFFSLWLSKLVNLSLETGIFPEMLKFAKVTPLHKKESKLDHRNYRAISLLSVYSKIFEKLIYARIYAYLVKYKLIYSKQFGFRGNHSVNHAIISMTEHIRNLLDNGEYVCGIFVDLEKAFDTVHHEILCEKIKAYGLHGKINDLLKSYLTNRKQCVSINGIDSEYREVTCGVPQGSTLGPLLFLIYINDFRLCLSKTSSGHFADDTFIIFNSKKAKTIETVMNTELKEVIKWLRLNKLSLNAGKTELIFFHSPQHKLDYDNIYINFNGIRLKPVNYIKYLGMYIDRYLTWDQHISELSKKLSQANGMLAKLRYNAPLNTCLEVYYAIFYSRLTYGCNVWGLASKKNISAIEVLQNKCIRIMTFAPFNSHIPNKTFLDLKLLKVRDIIKIDQLKLVHNFQTRSLPEDLLPLFKLSSEIRTRYEGLNSVVNKLLWIPPTKTVDYGTCSIKQICPKLWNDTFKNGAIQIDGDRRKDIPLDKIKTIISLKNAMKKHFFCKYSIED